MFALQGVQADATAAALHVPAGQRLREEAEVPPVAAEKAPAPQGVQEPAPAALHVPAPQIVTLSVVEPAGQA